MDAAAHFLRFGVRRFWFDLHVDHWIDHGFTSPTVHVLGRNMLAHLCVGSLPPLQGARWHGCWRQPCAGTMARRPVCRSTAGWFTLMPSLRPRSSGRGWAGFSCDSLRPLTVHDVDKQFTHGTWHVGLGWGLGTCKWRVAVWTLRTLMLTRVPSQPGAGETEHRQRGLFYRPGSPEIKLWRTRAPPSQRHKTADPVPSCRSLDRPLARSAVPDGRSIPELSTSRSAARQVSRPRQPAHP